MQSAIGCAQLNRLSEFIERKLEIYNIYKENLQINKKIKLFKFNEDGEINPHRIIIMAEKSEMLISFLSSEGIGVRKLFMPMHSQPIYNQKTHFPITENLHNTGICLPSAPSLTDSDLIFICKKINQFFELYDESTGYKTLFFKGGPRIYIGKV